MVRHSESTRTYTEPERDYGPEGEQPTGSFLIRGLKAFAEGRLPYQVQVRFDKWALARGYLHKKIRVGRFTVLVNRSENDTEARVANNIFCGNEYDPPGFEIQPGFTIVDIGGNIGIYSVYAATVPGVRVFAAEPDPSNCDLFERNVSLNQLTDRVALFKGALGDRDGYTELFQYHAGIVHSTVPQIRANPRGTVRVPSLTLPAFFTSFGIERCQILKLDCEGAEYQILNACRDEDLMKVEKIVMELHGTDEGDDDQQYRDNCQNVIDRLVGLGFRIMKYTRFTSRRPDGTEKLLGCGHLYVTRV